MERNGTKLAVRSRSRGAGPGRPVAAAWTCLSLLLWLLACVADASVLDCGRTPKDSEAPPTRLVDERFKLTISGSPDKYVPGESYTVSLQGSRHLHQPFRFTGFVLTVEPADEPLEQDATDMLMPAPPRYRHGRGPHGAGTFALYGDILTRFSDRCPNTVTQTSTYPKTEVQVLWTAPPPGSGCVVFRATVIEQPNVWYMDDGPLTYRFCEEVQNSYDEQPHVQKECCACEEAKYELTFEGLWSRHTHPKGFPDDIFLAKFSDVIGASHTSDYYFWSYGAKASPGLQQVAEQGSTRKLESELKAKSKEIRTIIKARGISFPNVTGKTFAVFRVDRKHHLMSIVSMIDPSPDWIVGVSGLELCLQNCSWAEYMELNLYPWDVGTDSGITYTSPNMPTDPHDVIRRITSSFPNNESSPFFDKLGTPMKPLARLYLTRQRLYEKSCSGIPSQESGEMAGSTQEGSPTYFSHSMTGVSNSFSLPECRTTEWSIWGPCSVSCGKGFQLRQRSYIDVQRADVSRCKINLTSRKSCTASHRTCKSQPQEWECEVTEWSEWSECSNRCGQGTQMRSRQYRHPHYQKKCRVQRGAKRLQETMACFGRNADDCKITSDEEEEFSQKPDEAQDPDCPTTEWSEWSACSTTCGNGTRIRTRLLVATDRETRLMIAYVNSKRVNTMEQCEHVTLTEEMQCQGDLPSCFIPPEVAREFCRAGRDPGPCRGSLVRWFFDGEECVDFRYGGCRGNQNKFETKEACEQVCMVNMDSEDNNVTEDSLRGIEAESYRINPSNTYGLTSFPSITDSINSITAYEVEPINCVMSEWTEWSPCSVTCGRGIKMKGRRVLVEPTHGGKRCPSKRTRTKTCRMGRCDSAEVDDNPTWGEPYTIVTVSDADCRLSNWSEWSHCSATCGHAYRQRTRTIIRPQRPGGAPCSRPTRIQKEKCELPVCKD